MNDTSILILMSDDVERLRLAQLLRHAGYEVVCASTVHDASQQLATEPIDLFLCELDHRDEERIALLTAAKWRLPFLARLLLIAGSERRIAQKALETGIVHFTLVPPVSQAVLLDTTRALLRWVHEQRLGKPAPQTGNNAAVQRRLPDTVDDDSGWDGDLDSPGPQEGPDGAPDDAQEPSTTSAVRGRVEWYY